MKCFPNVQLAHLGKTKAILWFIAKVSLKVSKVFIIYLELKYTNNYGGLGSKKAKDYMVEMEILRINQKSQQNLGNKSQRWWQVPPDQMKG